MLPGWKQQFFQENRNEMRWAETINKFLSNLVSVEHDALRAVGVRC